MLGRHLRALIMNVAGVVKDWLLIAFSWEEVKGGGGGGGGDLGKKEMRE